MSKEETIGKIAVNIKSKTKNYFKGQADSVTSINNTGIFDILFNHANFITLIKEYIYIDKDQKTEQKIEIENGVLSVFENKVDIYIGL